MKYRVHPSMMVSAGIDQTSSTVWSVPVDACQHPAMKSSFREFSGFWAASGATAPTTSRVSIRRARISIGQWLPEM